MTETLFDDAKAFFEPSIELRLATAVERRQRYSWPTPRWIRAGLLAASTLVFLGGDASATDLPRAARTPPRPPGGATMETRRLLEELQSSRTPPGIEAPNGTA